MFFSLGQHAWLDWNLTSTDVGMAPWRWPILFGVVVWAVWKDGKSLVFSQQSNMREVLWSSICNQVHFIKNLIVNSLASRDTQQRSAHAS